MHNLFRNFWQGHSFRRHVGRGGVQGAHAPPPPKSQKGLPDGIVKYLK